MDSLTFWLNMSVCRLDRLDRLDRLIKLRVTLIICPRNLDVELEWIGGIFPSLAQARVRSTPSLIMTPALLRYHVLGRTFIPWCRMVWPRMVLMYDPSCHVSWRQYPWIFCSIMDSICFSSLSFEFFPIPLTFWLIFKHKFGQVSLRLGGPGFMCPVSCGLSLDRQGAKLRLSWNLLPDQWPISLFWPTENSSDDAVMLSGSDNRVVSAG